MIHCTLYACTNSHIMLQYDFIQFVMIQLNSKQYNMILYDILYFPHMEIFLGLSVPALDKFNSKHN